MTNLQHHPRTGRRLRPAQARCHGGASSLLRLTPAGAMRLSTGAVLAGWLRAAPGDVSTPR